MRYPCTGPIDPTGFAPFLAAELAEPRRNLVAFAAELAARFNAPHLTLTNSGSSANLAAATALFERTGPGEALTAGFTFSTTANALLTAGYSVRLVDVEPGGFNLDPEALERAIGPNTRLVCATHFLGYPAALPAIRALCDAHGLLLLQDGCETMHLDVDGLPAHRYGDLLSWSFYHPHHLSAYGGGAVVAPDAEARAVVESVAHWGRACRCHYDPPSCPAPPGPNHHFHYIRRGHNLELSELNACFGRWQLQRWPTDEARRLAHAQTLHAALADLAGVTLYPVAPGGGSPFVFPITLRSPRAVATATARLADLGVETRNLMGGALASQPAYADLPHDGLTSCLAQAARSFFVGVHHTLPERAVCDVASLLHRVLADLRG